jgi:hypothetical protein
MRYGDCSSNVSKRDTGNPRQAIIVVDAHGYGKRFVVHADEKLTAFLELESAVEPFSASSFL